MRNIGTSRLYYKALARLPKSVNSLLKRAADSIRATLSIYGESIPVQSEPVVVRAAGLAIERVFVGMDGRQAFGSDLRPLSPFARLMNTYLATVQAEVVKAHAASMERMLPADVAEWLKRAQLPAMTQELRVIFPPAYDRPHEWLDPNGRNLSDRIWRTGQETRRRIDALISEGIRQGRSSLAIANDLEAFLLPSRRWRRTTAPYGRDASFDAMRLARTEISIAHSRASFATARANPFVNGMDWALSARHPKPDVCDGLATIGMSGQRIRAPYPLDNAPMVVQDSHPQCICTNRPTITESPAAVVDELRRMMMTGQPAPVTPLAPAFLQWLLGGLMGYVLDSDFSEVMYA
jgi:hypothetical protein